jgi:peptidoglycan/LPS O-acetylase OafA/YrhL
MILGSMPIPSSTIGIRRTVGAAVLALGSVYAGFQADSGVAMPTVALSAVCGAGLMWLAIKRRLFRGEPRPAWQTTMLGAIGAALGISAVNVLDAVAGPWAAWLFLAALLAAFAGAILALRLSSYGERELE